MCSIAKKNNIACYAGQSAKYEGLTVNAAEAINTMGGKAPTTGCDSTTVTTELRVDYSADYYFYKRAGET